MNKQKKRQELLDFLQGMPKAEIHVHLEGSVEPETVLTLAERNHMMDSLPSDRVEELRKWFIFQDFSHFIVVYLAIQGVLRKGEDFELVVYQNGADMAKQNIRYREITFTPFLHMAFDNKGLAIEEILEGLEAGRMKANKEFGVEIRWVFDVPRNVSFIDDDPDRYMPEPANQTLEYCLLGRDYGVVGFGLGGYEVNAPAEPFEHAFLEAKEEGLLSVPHAGETEGAHSVWAAVKNLKADRIGHGVRCIEDKKLVQYLADKQIPLEINPTSNICLHVYETFAEHPFRELDQAGVLVTVNSDDPPLFNTNLCQEYLVLAEEFGYGKADLIRIARNAFQVCGLGETEKSLLLQEFDRWAAGHL